MRVLVTGGAGYIGSHTVRELLAHGHRVTVLDNLERGHRQAIDCPLIATDLRDPVATRRAVLSQPFDGVIHFAASCAVGDSISHPGEYFENNVSGTVNLLGAMVEAGIERLVFSSSAAVYGRTRALPVGESHHCQPESPYGHTKLLVEQMLPWYERAYGLRAVALRYFNAAGSALDGRIGDDSRPATRLIPVVMKAMLVGERPITIYGDDYPTPDGTCIRDYVHVLDLASAHLLALEYLADGGKGDVFNLGIGVGYSNLQVLETARRVSGVRVPVRFGPRRPGDLVEIYADSTKIGKRLGWRAEHSDLETIIRSDWAWHSGHPQGYGAGL
jgi:UDP-glucose 4-epimerase